MTLSILAPMRPFSLGACVSLLSATALLASGCGSTNDTIVDMGTDDAATALMDGSLTDMALADQGPVVSCEVNNGGCSVSPMALCGLTTGGEVLCGACPTGYTGDGRVCTSATLMNECALNTHNCSPNATCTDTTAAFTCACASGFTGDGVTCVREGCSGPADCDDGVACTVDTCGPSGSCLHGPSAALCPIGALCHPTTGCMAGLICGSPADCVDSDPCTRNEICNAATATCSFALLDNDRDGEIPLVCGGTDCDDSRASVGASGDELCGNGVLEMGEFCDAGMLNADRPAIEISQGGLVFSARIIQRATTANAFYALISASAHTVSVT